MAFGESQPEESPGGASGGGDTYGIAAAINLLGGLISSNQQEMMAEHQNQWNKEQAAQANAWNIEQWNRMNEYNSPEAMMKRFRDAGLNPNLIYGGAAGGGAAGPVPRAETPGPAVPVPTTLSNLPAILSSVQDLQLKHAQVDNVRANTNNIKMRTINEGLQSTILQILGKQRDLQYKVDEERLPSLAGIAFNKAEASSYMTQEVKQRIKNLGIDERIKLIQESGLQKGLTIQDLEAEKRRADLIFQQYRNQWASMGVTSSDNFFVRVIARMFGEAGFDPMSVPKALTDKPKVHY